MTTSWQSTSDVRRAQSESSGRSLWMSQVDTFFWCRLIWRSRMQSEDRESLVKTVVPVGNDGGAWNPTGNMPVENMRRKWGSVMERKELQYIPIRSQSQQRVRELAARLYRSDAQRLFWFRVAVGCAAVTAGGNWGKMAIAQSAAMF